MFILQEDPIDIAKSRRGHNSPHNGALTSFEGMVRADDFKGSQVNALLYVADAPECIKTGEKIMQEVKALFPITEALCIQRIGKIGVEETAIWVGVWASHRDESFKACRYIIEEVKKRLVIWKKEFHADGSSKWIHGPETATL